MLGGLFNKGRGLFKGLGEASTGFGQGALMGAATGGVGSLLAGGNIISGALGGAMYGAGLGMGGQYASGRMGFRSAGLPVTNAMSSVIGAKGTHAMNYGYARFNKGFNTPVEGRGAYIGGGRVGVGVINSNGAAYASVSIGSLAGFAGGLIGMNGSSKSHSTLASNNYSMGTMGMMGGGY